MVECSQSVPPAFICATHLETLTCPSHCTICDICSRLQYQAEAHTVKGSRSEGEATIMTSLACSALATIGPGVLLRRGTHGCAPFSQHSACNIVFPIHNATLHTGFITPCQSAGGDQGYQCGSSRRRGSLRGAGDAVLLYDLNAALAVLEVPRLLLPRADAGYLYLRAVQLSVAVWHSWSFSPVTVNYWRECFCLTGDEQHLELHSKDRRSRHTNHLRLISGGTR